jgi:hypothetical protein
MFDLRALLLLLALGVELAPLAGEELEQQDHGRLLSGASVSVVSCRQDSGGVKIGDEPDLSSANNKSQDVS